MSRSATFVAEWVLPVDGPPVRNGFVRIRDGRVVELGTRTRSLPPGTTDLGACAILPGLVNAHTHLELTAYAGQLPAGGLWRWIRRLVSLRSRPGQVEREREAVRQGAELSLAAGVTTVGDVSRLHLAWPVLRDWPLRKVCFAELLVFADQPARDLDELAAKVQQTQTDERLIVGISPHAPYSVTADQIRGCVEMARRDKLPLTMHVAETRDERKLVEGARGRLYRGLRAAGLLKKCPPPRRPLFDYLAECGLLSVPALLAHVNYVSDRDLEMLAASRCSVAYCPRAHRFFGHRGHRFREMLASGINVCVGTDSLASNHSLSVLDELRFLYREHPDLDLQVLLEMGTIRGAQALGLDDQIGSLSPGKWADLVAIPLRADGPADPMRNVLELHEAPAAVIIGGRRVV